jgi:signal transduction histidine kinase/ActR/RegA family two-component response regulator
MGERMRSLDWSATPLGPVKRWPPHLFSALRICLDASLPIAIYWGPKFALLYNDGWSTIFRDRHPWALGQPGREVWSECWDVIGPWYEDVLATGTSSVSKDQLVILRRHGYAEECYFTFTLDPIRAQDGQIGGVFKPVTETTDRVLGERRMRLLRDLAERTAAPRSAEEVCALAAEALGDAPKDVPFALLYLVDSDGRRCRLAGIAGIERDTPASPRLVDLVSTDTGWPLAAAARTAGPTRVSGLAARLGHLPPGGPWPEPATEALVLPVTASGSGRTTAFLIAGISPRRALDEDYRNFLELAAGRVGNAVANARAYEVERSLVRAREEAERAAGREEALREANQRKDDFLAVLSHELRNPLGPIRNSLYLLDRADPGGALAARAKTILGRQVQHMANIVDDLLDVTRISRGKIELERRRVELREIVGRAVEDHGPEFAHRRIALEFRAGAAPIWIDADPTRIVQVVGNLLQNASKFAGADGHVMVSVTRDERGSAMIRVLDDGVGIEPELLPRLFQPFAQAEQSLHRRSGGLGLGLALVKGLVELHCGTVEARSDGANRGAEFTVRLPVLDFRDDGDQSRPLLAEVPARRVLVIEDNVDHAETLRALLALGGHEVEEAHDGPAGVEKAHAFRPDIVLCDIGLPGMNGYEVARALRIDPAHAATLLVAVTGYTQPEDKRRSAKAGFDHHLGKPVTLEQLESIMASCGGRPIKALAAQASRSSPAP